MLNVEHSLSRRSFFKRTALALPALLVGDAALEAFDRLTHSKVFLGADFATVRTGLPSAQWRELNRITAREIEESRNARKAALAEEFNGLAVRYDAETRARIIGLLSKSNPILAEMKWVEKPHP